MGEKMEIQETEQTNTKEEQKIAKKNEDLAKIAISKDADRSLVDILNRLHDGFDAGRASKQDVASQIILRFVASCTDKDIQAMRIQFFDPIVVMEATLRKAKETGVLPEGFRELLFHQSFASEAQPVAKRTKKSLNQNIIIDNVNDSKEAA